MISLLFLGLLCLAAVSWAESPPVIKTNANLRVKHPFANYNVSSSNNPVVATVEASPTLLTENGETVTVRWSNVSFGANGDWIGLFNYSIDNPDYLFVAPLKFLYICPNYNCEAKWHSFYPPTSGSVTFQLLNRRTDYVFAYVTDNGVYAEVQAVSDVVTFENLYVPMHVHLAVTSNSNASQNVNSIQVMWVQKEVEQPQIKYGTSQTNLQTMNAANWTEPYTREVLCDAESGEPAGTAGYFILGYMINAELSDLKPNTLYYYQVGDENYGWSHIYNFTSPPVIGQTRPTTNSFRVIAFGDLGQIPIDWALQHSWDNNNQGELFSINTTNTISTAYWMDQTDLVLHIGDIAYAVGYESEWDTFMHQIKGAASRVPWMTAIGNHENTWSGAWAPSGDANIGYSATDSGGECGVAYNFYFPFASQNPYSSYATRQPWYVIDYSIARIVVISTEHDFTEGSTQYNWVVEMFQTTNRTKFPWLILTGHREMYSNSLSIYDSTYAELFQPIYEPLLMKYQVALTMWGHDHVYVRTCPVYNSVCYNDGEAPVTLVIGMAGYQLSSCSSNSNPPFSYVSSFSCVTYGFVHLDFVNNTHCHGRFINANTTAIMDSFYVVNTYSP